MRSSDCGAPGRGTTLSRGGVGRRASVGAPGAASSPLQPPNAVGGNPLDVVVLAVADHDQRRVRRPNAPRVKRAHVVDASSPPASARCRAACGRTDARRRAASRRRGRRPRPACRAAASAGAAAAAGRARSRPRSATGRATMSASSVQRRGRRSGSRTVTLSTRRVRTDVGVELRAEARERLVHLDRRAAAAALVEHVGGHRGQPFLARRIVGRAAAHAAASAVTTGIDGWRDRPDPQAVRQRRLLDRGKRERPRRTGLRQARAVDRACDSPAHETTAGAESGSASVGRGRAARC